MDKREALDYLIFYWGQPVNLTPAASETIRCNGRPGETPLETVARIAEVDVSDIAAFDHDEVRKRAIEEQDRDTARYRAARGWK